MKKLNDVVTASDANRKADFRVLTIGVMVITAIALSACNRGRVVSTQDDSADYKSAQALPPLKKPAPKPIVVAGSADTSQSIDLAEPLTVASVDEPFESDLDQQKQVDAEVLNSLVSEEAETGAKNIDLTTSAQINTEAVIVVVGDEAKLSIERDADNAWAWLIDALANSDLTVFSRNKAAGRISIGCGEIGNSTANAVKRSGGWSIFNRKQQRISEYCALITQQKRGTTLVKVLDRAGNEVSAEYGRRILERVLNN